MKIFAHNFNPQSNSGPNKFTRQLFKTLQKNHCVSYTNNQQESDVEFCLIQQQCHKVKPMVLRLDGIWFNNAELLPAVNKGTPIDIVATLNANTYRGETKLQLMIKDIKAGDELN